ncbi:sensor histidine kinase [Yeosuana sp. AK3]
MNQLLKRQITEYLGEDLAKQRELQQFIKIIDSTYNSYDEQIVTVQQAMANSSQLIEYINKQTKDIVNINEHREKLVKDLTHQNQELNDYAHMVSHDLKSPLLSIDALVTWLQEDYQEKLDDQGNKNIQLIRSNVEKMDALITGILEYSSIGKVKTEQYKVDLNLLLEDVLTILSIPEHFKITYNKLPIVKGDIFRLQQVFQNLIHNAIKYNDKEKGLINISAEELDNHWKFSIKDNGKGIDETYFTQIFKTFFKLENDSSSTGMGLSIVMKIIDSYQGKIWLTSEIKKGSTFYFTIKK